MGWGSTKPTHTEYYSVGSGNTHDTWVSPDADTEQAYTAYTAVGSGNTHDSWVESTYEVLADSADALIEIDDGMAFSDAVGVDKSIAVDDGLELSDSDHLIEKTLYEDDGLAFADEVDVDTGQDFIPTSDSMEFADDVVIYADVEIDDGLELSDTPVINIDVFADDGMSLTDTPIVDFQLSCEDAIEFSHDNVIYSRDVLAESAFELADEGQVRKSINKQFSATVEVASYRHNQYSTELQIAHYDPAPVNDVGSVDNEFKPTIVVNGVAVVSNPATVRSGGGNYISYDESAIVPNCDLIDCTLTNRVGGGEFTIRSRSIVAPKGTVITLFGIKCLVIDIEKSHPDGIITTTGSVSDVRKTNQEILLVLDTSSLSHMSGLAMNTPLQSPPSVQWETLAGAAKAIANYAGVSFYWFAKDAPLTDLFIESTTKVIDALDSLAKRVNGLLVFDGKQDWYVVDPVDGLGAWAGVPNCQLLGRVGFKVKEYLDTSNTFVSVPVQPAANGNVTAIVSPVIARQPAIEKLGEIRTKPKDDQPPTLIKLPGDYGAQYFQFLHETINPQVVAGKYVPGAPNPEITLVPGSTFNPSAWSAGSFPTHTDKDGITYLVIQKSDFPDELKNGTFTMRVGYKRKLGPQANAYLQQQSEALAREKLETQANQERMRLFTTKTAQLSFMFFGSLPIPGNKFSYNSGGDSINGLVYEYTISKPVSEPARVTMLVKENVELNLLMPRALIDFYLATGTTP